MNLNFHYCAIKATAVLVGFSPENAEIIAAHSQFVDDFKVNKKLSLDNVPDYCAPLMDGGKFQTVQTGFSYTSTIWRSTQENVIMPFHFIPKTCYRKSGEEYQTAPARWHDKSIIDDICSYAALQCRGNPSRKSYILLGTALHVFADTYAHSHFNGFNSNLNKGSVTKAKSDKGESRSYYVESWLPPIGHAKLGTAPDESDLDYSFQYTKPNDSGLSDSTRTNWIYFADCAVEIGKYLGEIRGLEWSQGLENKIRNCVIKGCKVKGTKMSDLQRCWRSADSSLGSIEFNYRSPLPQMLQFHKTALPNGITEEQAFQLLNTTPEELEAMDSAQKDNADILSQLQATAADEFYEYNFAAFTVRKAALNGKIA